MLDLLKRWLDGSVNAQDEQALERAASKDAFLGDALEGYRSMPEADHEAKIASLKDKLRTKGKQRRAGMTWWRVAAAAAMIGVVVTWIFVSQNNNTTEIASNSVPVEKTEDAELSKVQAPIAPQSEDLEEKDELVAQESEAPSSKEQSRSAKSEVIGESKKEQTRVQSPAPLAYESSIVEESAGIEVMADEAIAPPVISAASTTAIVDSGASEGEAIAYNNVPVDSNEILAYDAVEAEADVAYEAEELKNESVVDEVAESYEPPAVAKVKKRSKTSASRAQDSFEGGELLTLNGKILDGETEEELIGVNVIIKGSNDGTVTDFDGAFQLQSNRPLPWTLEISYTGYSAQEVRVESIGDVLVLRLEDGGALLEEVVVTGYSGRPPVAPIDPRPRGGWKKFNKYIAENIQYPASAKVNRIEGTVKVSFYINGKGRPEQIKIMESLCDPCDLEAIRLVEDGPKWRPKKRNTIASIKFEL